MRCRDARNADRAPTRPVLVAEHDDLLAEEFSPSAADRAARPKGTPAAIAAQQFAIGLPGSTQVSS